MELMRFQEDIYHFPWHTSRNFIRRKRDSKSLGFHMVLVGLLWVFGIRVSSCRIFLGFCSYLSTVLLSAIR